MLPALRRNGKLAAYLAIASVGACLAITLFVYFIPAMTHGMTVHEAIVPWIDSGDMNLGFGVRLDELALTMTLVVTGVGFAIFVYALGYMHDDESMGRFYGKFALFVFSMLGIVLSPNFFQTFVFWELVGASSYLLIGYYWKKHSAGEAAKKAFMTNRVGDFGFLLGILMVWTAVGNVTGTLDFDAAAGPDGQSGAGTPRPSSSAARRPPRSPASSCSPEPWARAPSSRCTSGCPTPWKARRPSRR